MMACTESPLLGRKWICQCGVTFSEAVMSKLIGCLSNLRNGPKVQSVCKNVSVQAGVKAKGISLMSPPPILEGQLLQRTLV